MEEEEVESKVKVEKEPESKVKLEEDDGLVRREIRTLMP